MTNNDDFNAAMTDIALALADLASPQSDDTIDDLFDDLRTAADAAALDAPMRDAINRASTAIMTTLHADLYAPSLHSI